MWKKPESQEPHQEPSTSTRASSEGSREGATIGPSISIKGDLTGEENLIIQGEVEGKIDLKKNEVTVGRNGKVKADIYGKSIYVEGEVHGNLYGVDKIVIRQAGNVRGNLIAPKVTLEEGARFKGSIDMDAKAVEKQLNLIGSEKSSASAGEGGAKELGGTRKGGLGLQADSSSSKV